MDIDKKFGLLTNHLVLEKEKKKPEAKNNKEEKKANKKEAAPVLTEEEKKNMETIQIFQSSQGNPLPAMVYFQTIMAKGKFNKVESIEITKPRDT